jgi:hypothetical protein
MTAIAAVLHKRQIFVCVDSRLSTTTADGSAIDAGMESLKVLTLPHSRCAIAANGPVYATALIQVKAFGISGLDDVRQVATTVAAAARDWTAETLSNRQIASNPYTFVVAGFTRDNESQLYEISSARQFEPKCLTGTYCWPLPRAFREPNAQPSRSRQRQRQRGTVVVDDGRRSEPLPGIWHASVKRCIASIRENARESPNMVGGRIVCTTLTPDAIYQHLLEPESCG